METLELDIAVALRSFTLDLALTAGRETVALVGPSGAGKTTVLRALAGLARPARGRVALGGRAWFDARAGVDLPPERRSVGLVFQEYALFPHMTVAQNVAFGGKGRAAELLERLGIAGLAGERPGGLSGGERQRVALARALAREPEVLALDEPLSALDAHTRSVVRAQLQDVLADAGVPALLVTHDFRDATALADRIGVIVAGRLLQLGTAGDLVRSPADAFVARLTGANVLRGDARPLAAGGAEVVLDGGAVVRSDDRASGPVAVAVQPWDVDVRGSAEADDGRNAIAGVVAAVTPEGARVRVRVGELVAECPAGAADGLERGATAYATFAPSAARLVSR